MNKPEQLVLPLNPGQYQTFSSFADTGNGLALESVRQLADGISLNDTLLLSGPEACGKTHLLQAACQHCLQLGETAIYLDLNRQPELDGLENLNLLALDNAQTITASEPLQEALFHLLNRCQGRDIRLLLGSRVPPSALQPCLPDLQSRLTAMQQVRMQAANDEGLVNVLLQLSQAMQMDCPANVIRHLQLHGPRELHGLVALLLQLAETSLRQKRRPTLPLLREILAGQAGN